jgi:hypothetical protein
VHEVTAQAALHHPVGGDGRVDPAREQHERPSGCPDRKAAGAAQAIDRHEQLVLVGLDMHLEVGFTEVHGQAELVLHRGADQASYVHRGDREVLVPPA